MQTIYATEVIVPHKDIARNYMLVLDIDTVWIHKQHKVYLGFLFQKYFFFKVQKDETCASSDNATWPQNQHIQE